MYLSVASKAIIAAGAALVGLFSILGFGGGFDAIVNMQVLQAQQLRENGKGWEAWKHGESRMSFYFFNITNPDNFMKGAKAKLKEVGPYVYREQVQKLEVSIDAQNEEVQYRTARTYHFDQDTSEGSESDHLVLVNVVFIANAGMVQKYVEETYIKEQMDKLLTNKGEKLVMSGTARQFLFDGIPLKAYTDIFNIPAVTELGITLPEVMQDGKFALLKNKNGTVEDSFVIKSGLTAPQDKGKVVKFKDKSSLEYWRDQSCNSINGTDGSTFPPFLTKDSKLHVFSPGACRSFSLKFHQTIEQEGVEALQFVLDLDGWKSEKSNPENWCFCSKGEKCDKDGVLNVGPCTDGTPIILSQPHFLGAEESIVTGVDGLQPEFVEHATTIDVHPTTGIPVKSIARLQYSIELHQYPDMPSFSAVKPAILPIAWFEEISSSDPRQVDEIKFISNIEGILNVTHYVVIGIGLVLIGAGFAISSKDKRASPVKPFRSNNNNGVVSTVTEDSIFNNKNDEVYGSAFKY